MVDFYGLPTQTLANEWVEVTFLAEAGPRIVGFAAANGGDNVLAAVPDKWVEVPNGRYYFRGGHRLWHAPEKLARTYVPDNDGLVVVPMPHGVRLRQPTEAPTGITKEIHLQLDPERPYLTLHHKLTNDGVWPVTLAPWAITQMRLGGTAVIPQLQENDDSDGLLPNCHLVMWPYTSWQDGRLHFTDEMWYVRGEAALPACKIGTFNKLGWLAYKWGDYWFCKRFTPQLGLLHPDQQCNVELYVNDEFIELETLGALQTLLPQESMVHTETWELYRIDAIPPVWKSRLSASFSI